MLRALPAAGLAFLLLAGCLGPDLEAGPDSAPAAALPPGCDAGRPAVAHRPSGAPAAWDGPLPVPCLSRTGQATAEPTIGVTASGAVAFYPVFGQPVAMVVSEDEGATWTTRIPSEDATGQPTHPTTLDPYLYVDPAGDTLFAQDLLPGCSPLSITRDLGRTWTTSVVGCTQTDHQTLFGGPPRTSPTLGYPSALYYCTFHVGIAAASVVSSCQKSLDGGVAWLQGGPIADVQPVEGFFGLPAYCPPGLGHGSVAPDGTVFLPGGVCGPVQFLVSEDEALTWRVVHPPDLGRPTDECGFPAHDAGIGADRDGNWYFAWVAADRLPHLTVSRDRGATWSEPVSMAPPGLKEAAWGQLAVGAPGRVAFTYMGSMDAPGPPFPDGSDSDPAACIPASMSVGFPPEDPAYAETTWGGYMVVSTDALSDDPTFLTVAVNPPDQPLGVGECGPERCREAYDFNDIRIGPDGTPWASFVDQCASECDQASDVHAEGVAGRVWGVDLWDDADPNGPYPGP